MKLSFQPLLLLLCLLVMRTTWSQVPAGGNGLAQKPLEELRAIAKTLVGGTDAEAFNAAAFSSKRMDFLELCWSTRHCQSWFLDRVRGTLDPHFRNQLLLMMLRCPSPSAWPDDSAFGGAQYVVASSMRGLLQEYLPGKPESYEAIASPDKRKALAIELEAAIKAKRDGAAPASSSDPAPLAL
jgi:hypothetical protein